MKSRKQTEVDMSGMRKRSGVTPGGRRYHARKESNGTKSTQVEGNGVTYSKYTQRAMGRWSAKNDKTVARDGRDARTISRGPNKPARKR